MKIGKKEIDAAKGYFDRIRDEVDEAPTQEIKAAFIAGIQWEREKTAMGYNRMVKAYGDMMKKLEETKSQMDAIIREAGGKQ